MQSTEHDSSNADAAEYVTARKIIQSDVAQAAAHGGIESVIVAVDEATGLLDRTPWAKWDAMGCLVLTMFPAGAGQSLDSWGTALARWVTTHAEVEQIRCDNKASGWSTIVVNPGEVLDIVRADLAAELPGAADHVIPADAGERRGPNGWDAIAADVLTDDDFDDFDKAMAEARRRLARIGRLGMLLVACAVAAALLGFAASRAGAAQLDPAYIPAPGHEPSIGVACDGDELVVSLRPWDRVARNFQVWAGPRLLVNVNEPAGEWRYATGTVTRLVWVGASYAVDDSDCTSAPSTTVPSSTTSTSTPTTTSTAVATPSTLPPVTVTTRPPATTVPPATSTSVSPTTVVVPPNDPHTPLDPPPVVTTWATTPPPADVPPATADVPPPVSASPPALTGGRLPRTGGDPWALLLFGGAMVLAGAGIVHNARKSKES